MAGRGVGARIAPRAAQKMRIEVSPMSGVEIDTLLKELYASEMKKGRPIPAISVAPVRALRLARGWGRKPPILTSAGRHKPMISSLARESFTLAYLTHIDPLIALGVVLSTALTDAVYVMFNAGVSARRRFAAASWSSVWYLLSAFAVINYTSNWAYVLFAAAGSWLGGFLSITILNLASPRRC